MIEARWQEPEWRSQLRTGKWIAANELGVIVGVAALVGHHDPHVESVWVAPSHRRRGVFRALVRALADEASRMGLDELQLWVLEDNEIAQRAYTKLGFIPGPVQRAPDPRYREQRFTLAISGSPANGLPTRGRQPSYGVAQHA